MKNENVMEKPSEFDDICVKCGEKHNKIILSKEEVCPSCELAAMDNEVYLQ